MALYASRKTVINIGNEAVASGTQAASLAKWWGGMQPLDRQFSNRLIKSEGIRDGIETESFVRGYKDIKFNLLLNRWQRNDWLYYVFGQQSESGPASGVYTHTLTPLNQPYHPSFSLEVAEKQTTNSAEIFLGGYADGLEIKWQRGGLITASIPAIFQDLVAPSSSITGSATNSAEAPFMGRHIEVTFDGSGMITNSGTIRIKKNALAEPVADSTAGAVIAQPEVGEFEYEVELVRNKSDNVLTAAVNDAAEHDIIVKISRNATNDYVQFTINNMYADDRKAPIDLGSNVNIETIMLRGGACSVEVKDDHAW